MEFVRQVDIAITRNYDLRELLRHELISMSLRLTKDGLLRKSPNSELAQVLKQFILWLIVGKLKSKSFV